MAGTDWHLERGVSISHIIVTITLFMALSGAWMTISERIAILETQLAGISNRIVRVLESQGGIDSKQDSEILQLRRETREDLSQINNKLDRLIESL